MSPMPNPVTTSQIEKSNDAVAVDTKNMPSVISII